MNEPNDTGAGIPRIGPNDAQVAAYAAGLMHGLEAAHRGAERMTRMMAWGFLLYIAGVAAVDILYAPFSGFSSVSTMGRGLSYAGALSLLGLIGPVGQKIALGFGDLHKPLSPASLEKAIRRLVYSGITVLGLAEVPVLVGTILFLFGGSWADFGILFATGYVAIWLHRPRYAAWRSLLVRQYPELFARRGGEMDD